MNIVEINTVNRASTGSIMRAIANCARSRGHRVLECYPNQRDNRVSYKEGDYLIGNRYSRNIWVQLCSFFKCFNIAHTFATIAFIRKLKSFNPDVIHLHNLHPLFLNLPLLFNYINKNDIKVIVTQHDCWLYTGHCPYYSDLDCHKWTTICNNCPAYRQYPVSHWDDSSYMFKRKRDLLLSLKHLTLIPVSKWLGNEVSKSFLQNRKIQPISNGINLSVFKPTYDEAMPKKYGLGCEYLIMGCATDWGYRKGLDDYLQLSKMLRNDEKILLVGIPDGFIEYKPSNIITIGRTEDACELACLYTRANVLLSLSKEETFGLTIVEAMACGTPAIVYDNTAQPELINGQNGLVAPNGDIRSVRKLIDELRTWNEKTVSEECISFASSYNKDDVFNQYVDLMEEC